MAANFVIEDITYHNVCSDNLRLADIDQAQFIIDNNREQLDALLDGKSNLNIMLSAPGILSGPYDEQGNFVDYSAHYLLDWNNHKFKKMLCIQVP